MHLHGCGVFTLPRHPTGSSVGWRNTAALWDAVLFVLCWDAPGVSRARAALQVRAQHTCSCQPLLSWRMQVDVYRAAVLVHTC